MPKESAQKKLGGVRPPRVHITYDVEVNGSKQERELPFVVGVLADLSGQSQKKQGKLTERRFTQIDSEDFDNIMEKLEPRVFFNAPNTLDKKGESELTVDLKFKGMNDFRPESVARSVPRLRELLELREKLSNLRSSLYGNTELEKLLRAAVAETQAKSTPVSESSPNDQTAPAKSE